MRVLVVSQGLPFPVYRDGLTLRVFHLLQEFAKKAACHLVAFADYQLTSEELEQLSQLGTYDVVPHQVPSPMLGGIRKILSPRRYYSKTFERRILSAITSFRPDVAVAEQTFMSQYAGVLGNLPKVISAVDAISLAARRQAEMAENIVARTAWRFVANQRLMIEKAYFPRFDRITVVAQEDADFLTAKLGTPVHVVPNGVDTEYFSPASRRAHRNAVVFTGNLGAPMNEEACTYLLREVFPRLAERLRDVVFRIAGRSLPERIAKTVPPYVEVRIDLPDIRTALYDAALCVLPIQYGTGIKNNALQAMAMGIPVVVTPLVARPIAITHGETGYVAERGKAFVNVVERALKNRAEADRVGTSGRDHVMAKFSWERIASTYLDMLHSVSVGKGRG